MSQKSNNATANANQTAKVKKPVASPVYTVDEFSAAPETVGAKNADIVRAALTVKGKASYTIEEATEIVKQYIKKEVK